MALVNLCQNPGFEHDTNGSAPAAWGNTGWGGGSTLTVTNAQHQTGSQAMQAVITSGSNNGPDIPTGVTPVAGTTYFYSVWLKGNAGGENIQIVIGDWNTGQASATSVTLTTSWQQFTGSWTAPAGQTHLDFCPRANANYTIFVDSVQIIAGTAPASYADGDSAGWYWSGTAGNSASVQITQSYYDSIVLADSPKMYLPLSDPLGTTAIDLSGNSNNGLYTKDPTGGVNLPTLAQPSLLPHDLSTAVKFDGTGACVQIPNFSSFGSTFSLEGWFKFAGPGSLGATADANLWGGNGGGRRVLWGTSGTALLAQMGGGNYFSNVSLATGTPYYVVYTVDGTTEILYVNTAQQGSNANSGAGLGAGWYVGAEGDGNYALNGTGQKIAVYNYKLTSAQILKHYTAAVGSAMLLAGPGLLSVPQG